MNSWPKYPLFLTSDIVCWFQRIRLYQTKAEFPSYRESAQASGCVYPANDWRFFGCGSGGVIATLDMRISKLLTIRIEAASSRLAELNYVD